MFTDPQSLSLDPQSLSEGASDVNGPGSQFQGSFSRIIEKNVFSNIEVREDDIVEKVAYNPEVDVLGGQGHLTNSNPGNHTYLWLRDLFQESYRKAQTITEKHDIVYVVIQMIETEGGRFLKMNKKANSWEEIEPKAKRQKVMKAFTDPTTAEKKAKEKSMQKEHADWPSA